MGLEQGLEGRGELRVRGQVGTSAKAVHALPGRGCLWTWRRASTRHALAWEAAPQALAATGHEEVEREEDGE